MSQRKGHLSRRQTKVGRPSTVEDKALLKMAEQQPCTSTCMLSLELGPSQSTINQHLHKFGLVNRRGNSLKYNKNHLTSV